VVTLFTSVPTPEGAAVLDEGPPIRFGPLGVEEITDRFALLDDLPVDDVRPTSLGPEPVGITTIGTGGVPPGAPGY
jgi:hypothetical protein